MSSNRPFQPLHTEPAHFLPILSLYTFLGKLGIKAASTSINISGFTVAYTGVYTDVHL